MNQYNDGMVHDEDNPILIKSEEIPNLNNDYIYPQFIQMQVKGDDVFIVQQNPRYSNPDHFTTCIGTVEQD